MIEVRDLRKTYHIGFWRKPLQAIKGVTLSVREGELYGFIGPNGAGKSTTIKILLGLLSADGGTARLMGKPAGYPGSREQVGFLPEQPYFYDYLTGREFLGFYGRLARIAWRDLGRRVGEVSELVGLKGDALDRKLRTYSKGMLQRIGLAQALLGKPRLVILDEPMSGLDPLGRRDVRNILKGLHADGITVFYSSHVLSDVEAICTRLAMVVGGEVRHEGTVSEVLSGGDESFHVVLTTPLDVARVPQKLGRIMDARTIVCADAAAKRECLQWALDQNLEVEAVARARHSLEDVLAQEVAKHA